MRRAIAALGITQIASWGTTYYALGALSQAILDETGWSSTIVFGAFSAAMLLNGMVARPAGRMIDSYGARQAMAMGSAASALGCTLLALATHPALYIAGWLVLGVSMRLTLYDAAFTALAQLSGSAARRSISYLTLFGGFASTVFWPAGHALAQSHGWQMTFLAYAALHLFLCLPLHLTLPRHGNGDEGNNGEVEAGPQEAPLTGRDRTRAIVLLASAVALNGMVFSAISANVLTMFESLGFAAASAVLLAALIGPSQVAARIGDIALGRNLSAAGLGIVAFGLLPLAAAVFAASGFGFAGAVVFVVLYGASNGLITIARGAVPLALFGRTGYGEVLGTIAAPALILNAIAPTLFAILLERGGAHAAMGVTLAFGILSVAGMVRLAWLHPR